MSAISEEFYLELLRRCGALRLNGHYVLQNGGHSDTYVAKSDVTALPGITTALADELANLLSGLGVEVVVSPAIGAIPIGFEVAFHLSQLRPDSTVRFVYAEKSDGGFELNRGYDQLVRDRRCAVVEDIVTSGATVQLVVDCIRRANGNIVGVGCIWNRAGAATEGLGVPKLESLITRQLSKWSAEECPLCTRGVPINTELGHGAEFLAKQQA
ncbi:MAG: hypothetical protein HY567_00675 [Candidatus Kerfeldbacteria bacterium]|nr:hypothetical protein [Candidatus Kerfeldbacteria bacterium]